MLTADDPNSPLEPAWATIFWASGAMSSSASDLARWGDALYDDDMPGRALLERRHGARDARRQPRRLRARREAHRGLAADRLRAHRPAERRTRPLLLHLPDDDVTIALLVNRTEVDLLGMIRERPAGGGPSLLRLAIDS